MNGHWITSVGLDLGTSTTKLIVSRLRVEEVAAGFSLSRYEIVRRELLYAGPVRFTPLLENGEIHGEAVAAAVAADYASAGIEPERIGSGAVIVTGETATKTNAEPIVHRLAGEAGSFVVASAGPDLEGVLAGKGAGADRRSLAVPATVANIDTGGGTANIALFRSGKVLATATFHVGGRLIRLTEAGRILYVAPPLREWLKRRGIRLRPGMTAELPLLKEIAEGMSRVMLRYLSGEPADEETELLSLGPLPAKLPPVDEVMYSGGIGELMRRPPPKTVAETARYGDIGPLLAHCLAGGSREYPWRHAQAEQTVRATVIGAGMQSTTLSGSTIHAEPGALPLRNVPVLPVELPADAAEWPALLRDVCAVGERLFATATAGTAAGAAPFALAIRSGPIASYQDLASLAEAISRAWDEVLGRGRIGVVVCETDVGQALGQLLALHQSGRNRIVCIDPIRLESSDYIDIGEEIGGRAVPVIVKTLAFPLKEKEGVQ